MSGYYAKVKEGFDAFCLDIHNLHSVLKREVWIVQGVRSQSQTKSSNEIGIEKNESHSLHTEFNGLQAGEGDFECGITSVLKMECKVYKRTTQYPHDSSHSPIKSQSERAFMAFCLQHGIPYLPNNTSENDGIYTRNNGKQKASGNPNKGGSKDSGKSHREDKSSSKGNPTESRPPAQAGAGGAGGGRPPSDSSSSPSSDFSISTVNLVSETSPNPSMTSLASATLPRTRTKKFRKQKPLRVSGEEAAPVQAPKQKPPLPPPSAAPSIISIATVSNLSPRKPKTVKIKADSADREHLQIRTFSVTGKKQKTANLNQKNISVKKINQKEFNLPPSQKSKKVVNQAREHENLFGEMPSQKMKPSKKRSVAPSVIPQIVDPSNKGMLKPTESQISRRSAHRKLRRHRHHYHRPSFYDRFVSTQNIKKEKSNEWLSWSTSDESVDEDAEEKEKNRDPKVKERPIDPDLQVFTSSVSHLYQLNDILGLNPYKRVLRSNKCIHVKWRTKSCEFFGVCCNAIIFSMCTLSIVHSLLSIFSLEAPYSASHVIEVDDFANNLGQVLFFVFITFFLSIWSISCIMELGPSYAEFMTRFNLAICLIKYDVSEGIHKMVHQHLLGVAAFLLCVIALFYAGRVDTSLVRESCGFLGFCILRPFNTKLRESVYFPLVEIFGLVVFVHGFLCFNVVLLQFAVYGKALGNMAKNFNLRVAYALGKIMEFSEDGSNKKIKKVIPFQKLYSEHLIIASLYRNMSHVNAIVFATYFVTMGLEIVLTIWMILQAFLDDSPKPEEWYMESIGYVDIAVPLRAKEFRGEVVVAMFIQLDVTMLTYWLFGGIFHLAGEFMHYSIEYVRRHGMLLCKSANERRFVLSMMVSYSPKNPYWIGRQFTLNRAALVGFLAFVTAASMVTVSFQPKRSGFSSIEKCTSYGKCTNYKVVHSNLDVLYAATNIQAPPAPPSENNDDIQENQSGRLLPHVDRDFKTYKSQVNFFPSCASFSLLPASRKDYAYSCHASWEKGYPSKIKYPTFYTKVKFSGGPTAVTRLSGTEQEFYKRLKKPFQSPKDLRTSACRSNKFSRYNIRKGSDQLFNCFGAQLISKDVDDCGSLNTSTPNKNGKEMSAILRPVHIQGVAGIPDDLMCCFHYRGIDPNALQLKVCNMPNALTYKAVCKVKTNKSRLKNELVSKHYRRLLAKLNYEKRKSGNDQFLRQNEDTIRNCLCSPLNKVLVEGCFCPVLYLPPCVPGYFTGVTEDYAVPCGPVYVPILFKINWEQSVNLPSKHMRFEKFCNWGKGFPFGILTSHGYFLTSVYSDLVRFCAPKVSTTATFALSDCSGTPIPRIKLDDCSNWDIKTPDATSGKMKPAILSLRALNYDLASKQIVDFEVDSKLFLCCYQYASQVFQTDAQKKFCNAPNAEAANNWCSKVVQSGGRDPSPFDQRIYEQFRKKLELVIQHRKKKGYRSWLHESKNNRRWTKCMCSNEVEGLTPSNFEGVKKECINDINPPHELYAENIIDISPPCNHKWPIKLNIPTLKTVSIFIKENGIWESTPRFEKVNYPSQMSDCHEDHTFQERFRSDLTFPSVPIYDSYLNQVDVTQSDECGNLNVGVRPTGFSERKMPRVNLVFEYKMSVYDPSFFHQSETVYCCFHYETFGEQWRLCNMPDAISVMKKCKRTTDPIRRRHEKELVRKMLVHHKGAYELGEMVHIQYPEEMSWDSNHEKIWKACICDRPPSNSYSDTDKKCEGQYLPPCIVPKIDELFTPLLTETYTECKTSGPAGWPATLHLPIIMRYTTDSFIKVPLFRTGSTPSDCPNGKAQPVTINSPPNSFSDCYGHVVPTIKHDECRNPRLASPLRKNLTQKVLPTMRLIPLNQIPGFPSNDQRFFCCYQYAISETNEVKVCNKLSKSIIESHCSISSRSSAVASFVEKLKVERLSGSDVLADSVSFKDERRVLWTRCICRANLSICDSLIPTPKPKPPTIPKCFTQTESRWLEKMFLECTLTEPSNGHKPWTAVNRNVPFIYPKILKVTKTGHYKPVLTVGPENCKPFNSAEPLNSVIDPIRLSINTPVYDCRQNLYPRRDKFDYTDDLGNLVLRGQVKTASGSSYYASRFTLVPVGNQNRFLCCVEYNRGRGFDTASERQAATCSMPNFQVFQKEYDKIKAQFEDTSTYNEKYHKTVKARIERMKDPDRKNYMRERVNIKCLCKHLRSVRNHPLYQSTGTNDEFKKTCDERFSQSLMEFLASLLGFG